MKILDNLDIERGMGLEAAVEKFEQWYCWWSLEKNAFNQSKTAEELKTHRNNLVRRIHDWGWTEKVAKGYEGKPIEPVSGINRCPHGFAMMGNCGTCRGKV